MSKTLSLPEKLPAGPFRAWLQAYTQEGGEFAEVTFELGICERVLRDYKHGKKKNAPFDVVDTALQRARRIIELDGKPIFWVDDLYPELFATEQVAA